MESCTNKKKTEERLQNPIKRFFLRQFFPLWSHQTSKIAILLQRSTTEYFQQRLLKHLYHAGPVWHSGLCTKCFDIASAMIQVRPDVAHGGSRPWHCPCDVNFMVCRMPKLLSHGNSTKNLKGALFGVPDMIMCSGAVSST